LPSIEELTCIFAVKERPMPDLLIVGLQDIHEKSFKGVVKGIFSRKTDELINQWQMRIVNVLNLVDDQYVFFQSKVMADCAIMFFSKRALLDRIKELSVAEVKTATSGPAKNKGTVALKFKYDQT
jgi:hypothetical protein